MDVCSRFFCVLLSFVGRGLASGWSPVQGVLPTVQIDSEIKLLNRNRPLAYTLKDDDDDEPLIPHTSAFDGRKDSWHLV
jgi:hypothetical protein